MISRTRWRTFIVAVILSVLSFILLWWLLKSQPLVLSERVPGMDERPKITARSDSVVIGQFLDTLSGMDEIVAGDWPRFRGTDFDNISKDITPLAEKWDTSGPAILLRTTLG